MCRTGGYQPDKGIADWSNPPQGDTDTAPVKTGARVIFTLVKRGSIETIYCIQCGEEWPHVFKGYPEQNVFWWECISCQNKIAC
jgi:hypothetical protein